MSWRTKIAKLAVEFGDDIVRRIADVLPEEATEREARAAARNLTVAAKPNRPSTPKPSVSKAAAPKATQRVAKPAAPAIIRSRAGTPQATAQDVLSEAANPSKGSPSFAVWRAENPETGTLFDLSNLAAVPNVPQIQMPRYEAPRGPSPPALSKRWRTQKSSGVSAKL